MTILTVGTWDIFHRGHANLLTRCKKLGDLVVGINTDEFVKEYKGEKPLDGYEQRSYMVSQYTDDIWPNHSAGKNLIEAVEPDILVVGSDWCKKDYYKQIGMTQEELDASGILLIYLPYTPNISSTMLKKELVDKSSEKA